MIKIDINDPRLLPYSSIRGSAGEEGGLFIADAEKTVVRLLESKLEIRSLLCLEKYYNIHKELIQKKNIPLENQFLLDKKEMETILGFRIHQGMMALAEKPKFHSLEELDFPLVILNAVQDSENIGSIIRNCMAFGINNMIVDKQSSHPYLRRSIRVSMGYIYSMNICIIEDLHSTLLQIKKKRIPILGTSAKPQNTIPVISAYQYTFPEKYAIVLGNEGNGISLEVQNLCDFMLYIQMKNSVSSLNVSNALVSFLTLAESQKI